MKVFILALTLSTTNLAYAIPLSDLSHEELANQTFSTLRKKFLSLTEQVRALNPNLVLKSEEVEGPGGEKLPIDSVYIPARKAHARNLIILTSGIHGVEAPAGSLEERIILNSLLVPNESGPAINQDKTALLIIHSMNPFGTKYGRRFNENNIDLNRNCFDSRKQPFPGLSLKNKSYEDFRSLLENPTSLIGLVVHGLPYRQELTRALSGQYEFPEGIYFGGQKVEPECDLVEKLITEKIADVNNIAHIDFHTGLGKSGINQIMLNAKPSDKKYEAAYASEFAFISKTMFSKSECEGLCEVQEFTDHDFATHGDITQWLNDTYPEKRLSGLVFSVTSEIGTENPIFVLKDMINENYCHWHPDVCGPGLVSERSQQLGLEFTPTSEWWSSQVYKSGIIIQTALARFSEL